jgi:hypothetical protein
MFSLEESWFQHPNCLETDDLEGYGGIERFYTAKDYSWLIYFSHENTVSFAGSLVPAAKELLRNSSLIGTVWRTVGNALCAVPPKRKKRGANAPRPQKRAFSIENVAFRLTISRFRVISNKVLSSVPFLCLSEKPSTAIVCMRGRR